MESDHLPLKYGARKMKIRLFMINTANPGHFCMQSLSYFSVWGIFLYLCLKKSMTGNKSENLSSQEEIQRADNSSLDTTKEAMANYYTFFIHQHS